MTRICPHKFDLERTRYYRIKACTELQEFSEVGTYFSDRFHPIKSAIATKEQSEFIAMLLEDSKRFFGSIKTERDQINQQIEKYFIQQLK